MKKKNTEGLKLLELLGTHGTPECNGTMIPKFNFLTSDYHLRVVGYCVNCGRDIYVEYKFDELQKMCPTASDPETQVMTQVASQRSDLLESFELPEGSKPN